MIHRDIKVPTPALVRVVSRTVVASFDGGLLLVPEGTSLANDLVTLAESSEGPTSEGTFMVGEDTVKVSADRTTVEEAKPAITAQDIVNLGTSTTEEG
jgi:hypothetical protein